MSRTRAFWSPYTTVCIIPFSGAGPSFVSLSTLSELRLPHLPRFSEGGHHGRGFPMLSVTPLFIAWQKKNGVTSAKPLIPSSEVPTLRKSRRVGQPLSWWCGKKNKRPCVGQPPQDDKGRAGDGEKKQVPFDFAQGRLRRNPRRVGPPRWVWCKRAAKSTGVPAPSDRDIHALEQSVKT